MVVTIAQLDPADAARVYVFGAFFIVVAIGALAIYLVRVRPVNRARARRGQDTLRWRQLSEMRAPTRELLDDATGEVAERAKALARQIEWERQQASAEMVRYGRSRTRAWCAAHERFCVRPWEGPHPPGGKDHPTVPDDWAPTGPPPEEKG